MDYLYHDVINYFQDEDINFSTFKTYCDESIRNFIAVSDIQESIVFLNKLSSFLAYNYLSDHNYEFNRKLIYLCHLHFENLNIVEDSSFQKMQSFFLN